MKDAIGELFDVFQEPLPEGERRRVVVWHDAPGSFEEDFDSLAGSHALGGGPRPLRFGKVEDGRLFALKREVLRGHPDDDFLLYTRARRDLSGPGLTNDWLASLEFGAEHFQADRASLLMAELNVPESAADTVQALQSFFGAQTRRRAYLRVMPEARSARDVEAGALAVVLGAPSAEPGAIVWALLAKLSQGGSVALGRELAKYGADSALASLLSREYGYDENALDAAHLGAHMLLNAASCLLPEGTLDGAAPLSPESSRACLTAVRGWLRNDGAREDLYERCRRVESDFGLVRRFSEAGAEAVMDCDVFPCVNEVILEELAGRLADGADVTAQALRARQVRRNLKWYRRVEPFFEAVAAAADLTAWHLAHPDGFHEPSAKDAWGAYVQDWWQGDRFYRAFCEALNACRRKASSPYVVAEAGETIVDEPAPTIPGSLQDALDPLAERVDGLYTNWFLDESNACWTRLAAADWATFGRVPSIPYQGDFFQSEVRPGLKKYRKCAVIVADGLRYEVAREAVERLAQETKAVVDLTAMESTFPSKTEFGMAALLPHEELTYDWATDKVLVDGRPCGNTEERQKVLRNEAPDAKAVQAKDLLRGNRAAKKALAGDADLLYIYQNKIDDTGEGVVSEGDVFGACEETVDDIVDLVKVAINDLKFYRVLVTSDHGFLYTREPLEEMDKVSAADLGLEVDARLHRRHILAKGPASHPALIDMGAPDVGVPGFQGLALRECIRLKSAGGRKNYAHGGVSLQEMCVPVIEVLNKKAGSRGRVEQQKAVLAVYSTTRRVSSAFFHVDLYQREPVGLKVLPAEYELFLADEGGEAVSDVQRVKADMASKDNRARVARPQFALDATRQFKRSERYWLVCRDRGTGEEAWREEYVVDLPE